tara:strand:- start:4147 stop:4740 length:594 start_codon:yes stop_codon:yes gene_type:complete
VKITREDLQRIIREELEGSDRPQKPFNPSGLDDSKNVTWDDHLDAMRRIFIDIGMDVIDYYQEKPEEFGSFTKEDARKEIIEVLQATVDNFVNDDLAGTVGLGEFLDDEFDDEPRMNTAEDDREEVIMESFLREEFDEGGSEYNVGDLVEVQISDDGYETNVEKLDGEGEFYATHGYSTSEKFLAKVIKVSQREYED